MFRQIGQVPFSRSHSSMQSAWKQCLHSGMHLSVSLMQYSAKHIGQVVSLRPGSRRLSPRITFWYDSMVVSSKPITIMVGSGAAATAIDPLRELAWRVLSTKQAKQAMPTAHVIAGTAMDKQMILNTCRPSLETPENLKPSGSHLYSERGAWD